MIVSVSAKRVSFPHKCACCGRKPDTEYQATAVRTTGKRVIRTQSATWAIPYCRQCLYHASLWPRQWGCAIWFLIIITGFIWLPIQLILDSIAKKNSRKHCCPTCCTPRYAVRYIGWRGTVETFDFVSKAYAIEFILANHSRIVNLTSQQRAEIDAYMQRKKAKLKAVISSQIPVESSSVNTPSESPINEEQLVAEALAKIETAKGPAARQNILRSYLGQITAPELQTRLRTEAARLEVHIVLDKVDSLKSKAAKKRHIEAAIIRIHSDTIPDEMQTQEISWLEDALKEIDDVPNLS